MATRHVRVGDITAHALLSLDTSDRALADAIAEVGRADAIVFATPIYKASYSGLLKVFLDALPQFALAGKAVLPLATGGSLAHALALDYALRPVLQSMGARNIVQSYFLHESQVELCGADLSIKGDALPTLGEAIHHLRCAALADPGDELLGHPRPRRSAARAWHLETSAS